MIVRPIPPDQAVLAFSLVAPFFVYGVATSQANMLVWVILVLLLFYGVYLWKRPALIARFKAEQAAQQAAEARIRRSIDRWMRLYYCADDEGVFEPGSTELIPVDQMPGYLARPE